MKSIIRSISNDFKKIDIKLFWKIWDNQGIVELSEVINFVSYDSTNDKILISTPTNVYFCCPHNSELEAISFRNKYNVYYCTKSSYANKLLLLATAIKDKTLSFFLLSIDLDKRDVYEMNIPENARGIIDVSASQCFLLTEKQLYMIIRDKVISVDSHDYEGAYLCGKWYKSDTIIIGYEDQGKSYLRWDSVVVTCKYPIVEILVTCDFLWIIDNNNNIRIYDFGGNERKMFKLVKTPINAGIQRGNRIWIFSSDNSIDIYDSDGVLLESDRLVIE